MQNTLAVISLNRIRANANAVKNAANVPLIAVVKDDAYGHGAPEVAHCIKDCVSAFAVSTADEGAALRVGGISKEILTLTPPLCEEEVLRTAGYSLTASVTSLAVLNLIARTCKKHCCKLRAHLAVNTGMNRYGFRPERVRDACRKARRVGLEITGVYSHFYLPQDERARVAQRALFETACERVREYFPDCIRHISATGGLLAGVCYDAVRAGLSLYGYLPSGFEGAAEVSPAMKIYATVAQAGTHTGGGIGYRKAEKAYRKIRTLRLGYGDGFFRSGGGIAAGELCMDACVQEGGGRLGERKLVLENVSEYARACGTTEYEVLVNIAKKAVKIYV